MIERGGDMSQKELWRSYSALQDFCPNPDGEAKVQFYGDNSDFIIRSSQVLDPEIAIVIPAFNEEKYLPRTLASINQSLKDEEIPTSVFVVNNASTDATKDIAKTFGAIVIDEPKKGIGQARQTGLESLPTSVRYVLTTDADTVVPINWIDSHYQLLRQENIVCTFGRAKFFIDPDAKQTDKIIFSFYDQAITLARIIQRKPFVDITGGLNSGLVKDVAFQSGGYRRDLTHNEDRDIFAKMSAFGDIVEVDNSVMTSARRVIGKGVALRLSFAIRYTLNLCIGRKISKDKEVFVNEYEDYR